MSHSTATQFPKFNTTETTLSVLEIVANIIAMLNQIFKFDSVMITKKEVINSIVFCEYFGEKKVATGSVEKLQQRFSDTMKYKRGEKASPEKKNN